MGMRFFKYPSSHKVHLKEMEILCCSLIISLVDNRRANHHSNTEEHRFLLNVNNVLGFCTRQTQQPQTF